MPHGRRMDRLVGIDNPGCSLASSVECAPPRAPYGLAAQVISLRSVDPGLQGFFDLGHCCFPCIFIIIAHFICALHTLPGDSFMLTESASISAIYAKKTRTSMNTFNFISYKLQKLYG